MIAEAVLLEPSDGIGGIYIGIIVAAFGVVYGFEVFEASAVLAVFDATQQVVLYVLDGDASSAERDQRGEGTVFLGRFFRGKKGAGADM
jgi:hypothetical protein